MTQIFLSRYWYKYPRAKGYFLHEDNNLLQQEWVYQEYHNSIGPVAKEQRILVILFRQKDILEGIWRRNIKVELNLKCPSKYFVK